MSKPGDWMKVPQNLADVGHALGGYGVMLTAGTFARNLYVLIVVQCVLAAYVIAKEYWYDLRYESEETLASSTRDALGYLLGSAAAWGVVLAHARWP